MDEAFFGQTLKNSHHYTMGMLLDAKKYLESKGISFKVFLHPPVYTVEEAKKYSQDIRGIHS